MERTGILERLDELVDRSAGGRGGLATVTGATAMGKTALLHALAERAGAAGRTVLSAAGSPHEAGVPHGVLFQLLHTVDAPVPGVAPSSPATAEDELAVARRTHRIVAGLAAERPVLIAVDDVQHVDPASLLCLLHLAQRLPRLRLALVLTRGVAVDEQAPRVLHDLLSRPNAQRFHLEPLSRAGVRDLVAERVSGVPADRYVAEVHRLSGGNPLLARTLVEEEQPPAGAAASAEFELPTGHVFHQTILACLHRLGPGALRVARGAALLDGAARPALIARLSGLDPVPAGRFLRLLTGVGVLDGTRFRSPGVRQAVLAETPHEEMTVLRHRAARLLHDDGAATPAIAEHLLQAGPLLEEWVPGALRDAAGRALAEGDVARGIRCLDLAEECCSLDEQRASVRAQKTAVRWQSRPAESARHFLSLKRSVTAGLLTGPEALLVAEGLLFHLDFDDAMEVVARIETGSGEAGESGAADAELAETLDNTRQLLASDFPGVNERAGRSQRSVPPLVTAASSARARNALNLVLERGADEYAIAVAVRALQDSRTRPTWTPRGFPSALLALCYAERIEDAAEWSERFRADMERRDAPAWRAVLDCIGALIALRRGRLADAVRQAEAAHARLAGPRWNLGAAAALAVLVEAHTAIGDHRAAARRLAVEPPPELFLTRTGLHYLYARGRHHLATGDATMALSDFLECGALMRRWNLDTPAVAPWRLGGAEAWLALGDRHQAARLVEEQLAEPDTGLVRSRGMALHSLASVRPAAERPALLQEALRLLEAAGARYEAASVLADLSRAYQRLGEKGRARTTARRAWRIAKSCHAEEMCQALLPSSSPRSVGAGRTAAGTRSSGGPRGSAPARAEQSAFAKLSDSERRVAVLAAQGYTNREIADRLFITVSTVEQHLTRVYRKMGIRNREQLLEGAHADSSEAV
ncbi:helix-turn-helix transcriptional regulator [Actinomadura gamaensis]|uniref:AAA family ATPase n=1 Tax=Actinomadura gamaensis TaxID=1763541 RepID=A0ABV9TVY8_9ACTN